MWVFAKLDLSVHGLHEWEAFAQQGFYAQTYILSVQAAVH
jgi:hypothetical protein